MRNRFERNIGELNSYRESAEQNNTTRVKHTRIDTMNQETKKKTGRETKNERGEDIQAKLRDAKTINDNNFYFVICMIGV
jgi:hypothetical protein